MDLNTQQTEAAHYDGDAKNILVVAGAGTGKTTTIVGRILFLIQEKNIPPSRILALTFTNKSAKDLVSRIESETNDTEMVSASTFHSFCIQIIKKIPKSFGYEKGTPLIIDEAGQRSLMADSLSLVMEDLSEKEEEIQEELQALIPKPAKIISYYSYARNSMIPLREYLHNEITEEEDIISLVEKAVELYEVQKKEYSYADFDDLLNRFVDIMEEKPELAHKIAELYDEVLVDELQDTNPVQYRVLKSLGKGDTRLFGVGDPAQSIYSFRGADFNSIYNFTKVFENSAEIQLSENYRSSQEILDFSNRILDKSSLNYTNRLNSPNGYVKTPVLLYDFETAIDEAGFIVRDIVSHVQERGGEFKDVFIITRSAYAAKETEAMLNRYQVPYSFIGGRSILKTAHVQDLIALLRFAISTDDKLGCIRFLELFRGIGAKTASRFYHKIKDEKDALLIADQLSNTVKKDPELSANMYLSAYYAYQNNKNPIKELVKNGFLDIIKDKYPDSYDYRIKDIELFSKLYNQYNGDLQSFINDFTMEPDLYKVQEGNDEDDNKVILITAHSAKGLERDVCYVLNATPGAFPSKRAIGNEAAEEEERRTFYVAITRAKKKLVITRNMQFQDYIFTNAKTNIDYIKDGGNLLKHKKKKINASVGGLSSLEDIF